MPLNLLPEVAAVYEVDSSYEGSRYVGINGFGMHDLENLSLSLVRYFKKHNKLPFLIERTAPSLKEMGVTISKK